MAFPWHLMEFMGDEPEAAGDWRGRVFPVMITGVNPSLSYTHPLTGVHNLYTWTEQDFSPDDATFLDTLSPREGTADNGEFALSLNDELFTEFPFEAWLRERGNVQGYTIYEFQMPPGGAGGGFFRLSTNTYAQITSNQNNYAINQYGYARLSSDASRSITGITAGEAGQWLVISNTGSFPIILKDESGSSSTANQIITYTGGDQPILPGQTVQLVYDATSQKWRVKEWTDPYPVLTDVTPAQITGNTNNYDPGPYGYLRLSTDASRNLTGIVAGQDGQTMTIVNVGSNNLVLVDESSSSTDVNRFATVTGENITLSAGETAYLIYDATLQRWVASEVGTFGSKTFGTSGSASTQPTDYLIVPVLTVDGPPTYDGTKGELICDGKNLYQNVDSGTTWVGMTGVKDDDFPASKGDILAFDGTDWRMVAAGTNGTVLIADSTATAGVKWDTTPGLSWTLVDTIGHADLTDGDTSQDITVYTLAAKQALHAALIVTETAGDAGTLLSLRLLIAGTLVGGTGNGKSANNIDGQYLASIGIGTNPVQSWTATTTIAVRFTSDVNLDTFSVGSWKVYLLLATVAT